MNRALGIIISAVFCVLAWSPAQASTLDIVYSANVFGVYSPCPS